MVKTKIICTLGPASSNETVLRKMMINGMDVCRLNFSHGIHHDLSRMIGLVRLLNHKYRRRIKFLGDLKGHRIRIAGIKAPIELKKRRVINIAPEGFKNDPDTIIFDYKGPIDVIKKGHSIFIDDGNICLEVISRSKRCLHARVVVGGLLKAHKGVNIPEARLEFGAMSAEDARDIDFCRKNRIEYIAQSFVRSKKDVLEVRDRLGHGSGIKVIAKIESREGIKDIDEIIKFSDGIMIARGDMGISIPIYEIPIAQKMIIKKCNQAGKFVITATQMLESMTEHPRPTRAEAADVANAIIDGTDFVMLSAETAVGRYPSEAVSVMNSIIKFTEKHIR